MLSLFLLQAQPTKTAPTLGVSPQASVYTGPVANLNPPHAEWHDALKDGTYVATFSDSTNHWRCFISGLTEQHGAYGMSEVKAFTVACADQTYGTVPMVTR